MRRSVSPVQFELILFLACARDQHADILSSEKTSLLLIIKRTKRTISLSISPDSVLPPVVATDIREAELGAADSSEHVTFYLRIEIIC